jgi:hypothetical protein
LTFREKCGKKLCLIFKLIKERLIYKDYIIDSLNKE